MQENILIEIPKAREGSLEASSHFNVHKQRTTPLTILIIIVVIITWQEKFDFVLVPEHDVTGILT